MLKSAFTGTEKKTTTDSQPNATKVAANIDQPLTHLPKPIQEELIAEWVAPSRPYKKHSRQFFSSLATIALLIIIILIFANQVIFALVIVALSFMVYLLFTIEPQKIYYAITTYGIRIGEELYFWEELGSFWFEQKYQQDVLLIQVGRFPHRLSLMIYKEDKPLIKKLLAEVLVFHRPKPTVYEKWANWLAKTFPLEKETQQNQKAKPSTTKTNTNQTTETKSKPASQSEVSMAQAATKTEPTKPMGTKRETTIQVGKSNPLPNQPTNVSPTS